jgi:signal transduction histidine kinase
MLQRIFQRFRNLRIRHKLLFGFGLLIVLMVIAGAASVRAGNTADRANTRAREAYEEALLAEQLKSSVLAADLNLKEGMLVYLTRGPGFALPSLEMAQQFLRQSQSTISTIEADVPSVDARPLIDQIDADSTALLTDFTDVVMPHFDNRGDEETGLIGTAIDELTQVQAQIDVAAHPEITTTVDEIKELVANFVPDPDTMIEGVRQITEKTDHLEAVIRSSDLPESEQSELLKQVEEARSATQAFLSDDIVVALTIVGMMNKTDTISTTVAEYVELQLQDQAKIQEDSKAVRSRALTTQYLATALAVFLALVLSVAISWSVSSPIHTLIDVTRNIAAGNYAQRTGINAQDESGQLAQSIDAMVGVIQVREADLREQAARLRVATAKAKEAARVKGEFLATVSHELRTPLNAIIGFSDILLMGMTGDLNEKQRHQIQRLRENGQRLLGLINDILDLSRIEAQRVELVAQPFSPRAMINSLVSQMEPLATETGLFLKTFIDSDMPENLVGDPKRIEQVFLNLLSNAFKFTEKGGVTIRASADHPARKWSVVVEDTGIGIPPHALDVIFEEFRQVDGSSTRAYQGSGLGLAVARNLVRIMEGQITVESELGKGSSFTVTLPLNLPDSQPALPATKDAATESLEV